MKNSEIAEATREILETQGWRKGRFSSRVSGGHCLVGAALRAMGVDPKRLADRKVFFGSDPETKLQGVALQVFWPVVSYTSAGTMGFNDSDSTTKLDVLNACDRAAKYWRDKGE